MLTVAELIGLLTKFPGGTRVVVALGNGINVEDAMPPVEIKVEIGRSRHSVVESELGLPAVFIGSAQPPSPD